MEQKQIDHDMDGSKDRVRDTENKGIETTNDNDMDLDPKESQGNKNMYKDNNKDTKSHPTRQDRTAHRSTTSRYVQ
jgi:hypothetical protein